MYPDKDKKDDKGAQPTHDGDHKPDPNHNAPMSDSHKSELANHDVNVSQGHVNHGPGHH